jgi:3-phenylpropionate/trans-cinnamate dioxygenase ferredoxin subunit
MLPHATPYHPEVMNGREEPRFQRIGTLAEIHEGEMRAYDLTAGRVGVANLGSELRAFGDDCTHEGSSLSEGELADEDTVVCPECGSSFDLRTGEPVTGPAEDPIVLYPARVEEGWVEVALG